MYGILWRWLIFFGFVFWISLCIQDIFYKTSYNDQGYYNEFSEELSNKTKKNPPCLTFWKTVAMVLSLTALIYIKRTSNLRKCLKTNFILSSRSEEFCCDTTKNYTVNLCPELKKSEIHPDIYSDAKSFLPKTTQGITGVELVQQKLNNLEKTVQSLKKRHISSNTSLNTSGIVSGSPEFRKFLSKLSPIESREIIQHQNMLLSSSEYSIEVQIDGKNVKDDSLENIKDDVSHFDENYEEIMEKSQENHDLQSNTHDNSWSTISETISEYSDPKLDITTVKSNPIITSPVITEILQARNFTDVSKTSVDEKSIKCYESVINMITDNTDYDDFSEVPGSNLVPSEKSSFSSRISSRHQINFFPSLSSLDDDDLLLNTLD